MHLVKAFKNFISIEEKNILNEWTLRNHNQDYFIDPRMDSRGLKRTKLTTRFATPLVTSSLFVSSNTNFEYPSLVYNIQRRIIYTFGFNEYGLSPVGKNGIITEIGFEGGTVHPHIDPVWIENTDTIHCNIITQKPKSGGITYIENEPWEVNETDLLMYVVSSAEHKVDEIIGDKNRILWIFSFILSKNDAEKILS